MIVCAQGKGWAEVEGVRHVIRAREALVIPRRTPHSYGADPADPWTIWWLHLEGALLPGILNSAHDDRPRRVLPVTSLSTCVTLIGEVFDHLERDETVPNLVAASGAALHLLTTLTSSAPRRDDDDPVQLIREALSEDLGEPLTIAQLSSRVNLSQSHLSAIFKQGTGYTPMHYRTLLRMRQARTLLDTTSKPIGAIARDVGYEDAAYFSRRFAELHEQSPSDYRSTVKG